MLQMTRAAQTTLDIDWENNIGSRRLSCVEGIFLFVSSKSHLHDWLHVTIAQHDHRSLYLYQVISTCEQSWDPIKLRVLLMIISCGGIPFVFEAAFWHRLFDSLSHYACRLWVSLASSITTSGWWRKWKTPRLDYYVRLWMHKAVWIKAEALILYPTTFFNAQATLPLWWITVCRSSITTSTW